MRRLLAMAGLAGAFAAPVLAADPRLITVHYRADVVERLDGHTGVEATIAFGDDEHIENVAIGDANLWQVTPNKRRQHAVREAPAAARADQPDRGHRPA